MAEDINPTKPLSPPLPTKPPPEDKRRDKHQKKQQDDDNDKEQHPREKSGLFDEYV